jgi:site-specific DNA-methyltransferase (adenine-specific)
MSEERTNAALPSSDLFSLDSVICGDARTALDEIPNESVDCIVTSPPYWNQRDYGYDGQLGHEDDPSQYCFNLSRILEKASRKLKPRGTMWVNISDTYADGCLCGIPWEAMRMLRDYAGMPIRAEICWSKPNPVPESVKTRPSRSHEWVFMLSQAESDYFYDWESIAEKRSENPVTVARNGRSDQGKVGAASLHGTKHGQSGQGGWQRGIGEKRNARSVWEIAVAHGEVPGHPAVMPLALATKCILAGSPVGGVVLDPFAGSGTTLKAAQEHGRRFVGIEANPDYVKLCEARTMQEMLPLYCENTEVSDER